LESAFDRRWDTHFALAKAWIQQTSPGMTGFDRAVAARAKSSNPATVRSILSVLSSSAASELSGTLMSSPCIFISASQAVGRKRFENGFHLIQQSHFWSPKTMAILENTVI